MSGIGRQRLRWITRGAAAIVGVSLLATVAIVLLRPPITADSSGPDRSTGNDHSSPSNSPPSAESWIATLIAGGWTRDAAVAVVDLNIDWFRILAEENPSGLARQLALLKDLGRHARLQPFIAAHPETAGLLAGVQDPVAVAGSLESADNDYPRLAGLYVQHAAPTDAVHLAATLKDNRDTICRLHQRGVVGAESLFLFDRDSAEAEEYAIWLREAIGDALRAGDEELDSLLTLVVTHGRAIRQRLRDPAFRSVFRSEVWPKMVRVAAKPAPGGNAPRGYEIHLADTRVWDLLLLPQGERLLEEWGLVPVDLLFGQPGEKSAYPAELHEMVILTLLRGDLDTLKAMEKFASEPQFRRLLKRPLPGGVRAKACNALLAAGSGYPDKLAYFDRLTDTAYLTKGPKGTMREEVMKFQTYLNEKEGMLALTLEVAEIKWGAIPNKYSTTVEVTVDNVESLKTNFVALANKSNKDIGTVKLKAKLDDRVPIRVKVMSLWGLPRVWDKPIGEYEGTLRVADLDNRAIDLGLDYGSTMTFKLRGTPKEPELPEWRAR